MIRNLLAISAIMLTMSGCEFFSNSSTEATSANANQTTTPSVAVTSDNEPAASAVPTAITPSAQPATVTETVTPPSANVPTETAPTPTPVVPTPTTEPTSSTNPDC